MKQSFIKKQIEEFDVELGKTFITGIQDGSYDEELKKEIKDFFAHAVSQAYDEGFKYGNTRKINEIRIAKDYDFSCGEMAMLEKVEGIVPELREPQEGWPTDPFINIRDGGFNSCRSTILTELKKLKEGI